MRSVRLPAVCVSSEPRRRRDVDRHVLGAVPANRTHAMNRSLVRHTRLPSEVSYLLVTPA